MSPWRIGTRPKNAYERGKELAAKGSFAPTDIAEMDFGLARAHAAQGDEATAKELARDAAAAYSAAGQQIPAGEVQAWLDERGWAGPAPTSRK